MRSAFILLLFSFAGLAADHKTVVAANGAKPVGPYSPGIVAGGLLYVSGQGARDSAGKLPDNFEAQTRQCLENVKGILAAQGLNMQHVVSTQVYLSDMKNFDTMNRIWTGYFPKDPPVRAVVGVTRMPTDTPVEITAVAVLNLRQKRVIRMPQSNLKEPVSPAIDTGDRVFLSANIGRDMKGSTPQDVKGEVKLLFDGAEQVLRKAGVDVRHLIYVNIYVDPKMPLKELGEVLDEYIADETSRTIIQTASLPAGVHVQVGGVASRKLMRLGGHCATVADTSYCSGRFGTIKQAMETVKSDLVAAGFDLSRVVATNVYMDDIDEFAAMNKVYAGYFPQAPPTRTTVQPWKKIADLSLPPSTDARSVADDTPRVQVSVIAVR